MPSSAWSARIAAQQTGVREASGSHKHSYQKRRESRCRVDLIRRLPADGHVLAKRFGKADLLQK
jgi:hypothetical protein